MGASKICVCNLDPEESNLSTLATGCGIWVGFGGMEAWMRGAATSGPPDVHSSARPAVKCADLAKQTYGGYVESTG